MKLVDQVIVAHCKQESVCVCQGQEGGYAKVYNVHTQCPKTVNHFKQW